MKLVDRKVVKQPNGSSTVDLFFDDGSMRRRTKHTKPKFSGTALNGLSVENLRKAGYTVSVHHYRAFTSSIVDHVIFLPKGTTVAELSLMPNGGYTHITILKCLPFEVAPRGRMTEMEEVVDPKNLFSSSIRPKVNKQEIYSLFSYCAMEDLFSYKVGVTTALDRLSAEQVTELLEGKA